VAGCEPVARTMRRPGLQLVCADEARLLLQHAHAQFLEALHRIVGGDGCDHPADVVHDLGEIDLGLDRHHAEGRSRALRVCRPAGSDQGRCAAPEATTSPPEPPPTMQTSGVSVSLTPYRRAAGP
jgi:hypothetical protein